MLTPSQLEKFDRIGAVTIDTPFTKAEIAAASEALDRKYAPKPGGFSGYDVFEPELLHLALHPFVVACVKQQLRADEVILRATATRKTAPRDDGKNDIEGEHVDICYRSADLDATPRRMLGTILIWLSDVTPKRAPFMFRPGSHRLLSKYNDMADKFTIEAQSMELLPKLPWEESVPVLANAGQISVCTTAVIHSGSGNADTEARKVMFLQWQARSVPLLEFNTSSKPLRDKYFAELPGRVPAEKRRLVEV